LFDSEEEEDGGEAVSSPSFLHPPQATSPPCLSIHDLFQKVSIYLFSFQLDETSADSAFLLPTKGWIAT